MRISGLVYGLVRGSKDAAALLLIGIDLGIDLGIDFVSSCSSEPS